MSRVTQYDMFAHTVVSRTLTQVPMKTNVDTTLRKLASAAGDAEECHKAWSLFVYDTYCNDLAECMRTNLDVLMAASYVPDAGGFGERLRKVLHSKPSCPFVWALQEACSRGELHDVVRSYDCPVAFEYHAASIQGNPDMAIVFDRAALEVNVAATKDWEANIAEMQKAATDNPAFLAEPLAKFKDTLFDRIQVCAFTYTDDTDKALLPIVNVHLPSKGSDLEYFRAVATYLLHLVTLAGVGTERMLPPIFLGDINANSLDQSDAFRDVMLDAGQQVFPDNLRAMDPNKVHKQRADFPLQTQHEKTSKASCLYKDIIAMSQNLAVECFSTPVGPSSLPSPEHPTDHIVRTVVISNVMPLKGPLVAVTANMCKMGDPFEFEPNSQTPSVRQAKEAIQFYRRSRTFAPLFASVNEYDPAFGAQFEEWCCGWLGVDKDSTVYAHRYKLKLDHDKFPCTSETRINQIRLASLFM